jgi:hypothetical protein
MQALSRILGAKTFWRETFWRENIFGAKHFGTKHFGSKIFWRAFWGCAPVTSY